MSVFKTATAVKRGATKPATATHTAAPVLITEQEVLFSTAASMPLPRRRHIADTVYQVANSVVAHWQTRAERRPVRRDRPSHLGYLEHSMMSREMDRL
ncbi:hypothetical protein [Mycolicibacterium sp. XJ870]